MRRLIVVGIAVAALAFGGAAAAGRIPRFPAIPGAWSHAEINVKIGPAPHTLILDRGRIAALSATQLRLVERDGTTVTIPVTPATVVTFGRRRASLEALRRQMQVETMRIDGGPAVRVRAGR